MNFCQWLQYYLSVWKRNPFTQRCPGRKPSLRAPPRCHYHPGPLRRNELAVRERLFAPGKRQHAVTLFPVVQNKHCPQICLVRVCEGMTQLGVSLLTHVTLQYHGQVMTRLTFQL